MNKANLSKAPLTDNNWYTVEMTANLFVRSSLFHASSKNPNVYVKDYHVASTNDYTIEYTGHRLDQFHRDVAIALKRLMLTQGDGNYLRFTRQDIYKIMGIKKAGRRTNRRLHDALMTMLVGCIFCFDQASGSFEGCNAKYFDWNNNATVYYTEFEPNFIEFFIKNHDKCSIDLNQRKLIKKLYPKNSFILWLHTYWSSFDIIPDTHIDEIKLLCGSQTKDIVEFTDRVNKAVHGLESIGFIKTQPYFNIQNNYICAEKNNNNKIITQPTLSKKFDRPLIGGSTRIAEILLTC